MRCVYPFVVILLCAGAVNGQDTKKSLKLTLPPTVYAVANVSSSIYFDNIVLTEEPDRYRFEVRCDVGTAEARRWVVAPDKNDIGSHALKVSVFLDENLVESANTTLQVVASDAGATADGIRLLIIGDSLTHASAYPNEVARLLSLPGNPKWQMLGSHKPASAKDGVVHEGYGGWTWQRFASHFEPNPDGTYRKRSSPFVFKGENGSPKLDVSRYFSEQCQGATPDYIVIMLGINDCFGAPPDDSAAMDDRINATFAHANTLLSSLREFAPAAQIGICLTTPPNSRRSAFEANYKERYTRWGWKRIQHRLVQRQIGYVTQKRDPKISIVPTQLNLDPVNGYPNNNGVHPNKKGYVDIGTSVYSWLKWKLAGSPGSVR